MARFTDTLEIEAPDGGEKIVVTSEALEYEPTEDLLPEIMGIVSGVLDKLAGSGEIKGEDDILKLAPALGGLAGLLSGGRLKALAPKILACTSVVMSINGDRGRYDMIKKSERAAVFEARPDLYFRILLFAGRVTFGRFFPAGARRAKPSPTAT